MEYSQLRGSAVVIERIWLLLREEGGPICLVDFAHPGRRINGGVGKPEKTMNGWGKRRELQELF